MKFLHPQWLWALAGLPLLYWLLMLDERRRKRQLSAFAHQEVWRAIIPELDPSARPQRARYWLCALLFGLLALARPQWGTHEETVHVSGLDIMVVLDVSNSMETEDIAPSRLKKAKHLIRTVLERLRGDRVGAVAFAASSYMACPLTTDLEYVIETLQHLGPRSILNQGTDIGLGLETAIKALERGSEEGIAAETAKSSSQVIILVSDGEDHEARAQEIAGKLRATGIKLFVFGVGTEKGGPIPTRDENGNLHGYKKSRKGDPIISSFHPDALMKLAVDGGGRYWNITAGEAETEELLHEMGALNRTDFSERRYVVYEDRYQYPLFLAVLFLLLELGVPLRRQASSPVRAGAALLAVLLTGCGSGTLDRWVMPFKWYSDNKKGVEQFKQGKIDEAKQTFGSLQARNPDSPELKYNQSLVQNQEGDAENAVKGFGDAAKSSDKSDAALSSKAFYNLGNVLAKKNEMKGAVEAYLAAIDAARRAKDETLEHDARKNLELLLSQIQKQKQQQKDQQQQEEKQQEQDKKENEKKDSKDDKGKDKDKDKQDKQQEPQRYEDPSKKKKQKFRSLKLSDEDAERVMSELKNREQELQGKLKKQQGRPGGNDKDW